MRCLEWICATPGDFLGISRSGVGVLAERSRELLGISVGGHGDPGTFACPFVPIGIVQRVSTPHALPHSPESLTVAASDRGFHAAGTPKALTVVWPQVSAYFAY